MLDELFLGIPAFTHDLLTPQSKITHHHQPYMGVQGVVLSTTSRMVVQECLSTTSSIDVHGVCLSLSPSQGLRIWLLEN
jgi:hypothetical protein